MNFEGTPEFLRYLTKTYKCLVVLDTMLSQIFIRIQQQKGQSVFQNYKLVFRTHFKIMLFPFSSFFQFLNIVFKDGYLYMLLQISGC